MTLAIKEEELWDVDYGIKLPDNFTIKAVPYKKKCKYYFYTPEKVEVDQFEADFPTTITERSVVGSKIKEHLNFNNTLNNRGVSKKFSDLKIALTNFVDEYVETEKRLQTLEETEKLQLDKEGLDAALHLFETTSDCILRIANYIDWYTAGERLNILLAFFCFCSQILLKTPISVVGLGDGSSGKTHIMEEALSLIPESYILREKKPTIAAMFRRSEENPYYYDGKIVVYGDMGGDTDQDDVVETKNILKELQSDGYVNRPITVKTSDGFVVVDLELKGNPCLGYTTIPNYTFDDQELSRSLIFTPRTNNRKIFNARKNYLELKGGKTEAEYQEMLKYKESIRQIVEGLRYKFTDIDIINPYSESIFKFIGDTEYYKRDYDKFNSILKVITAFNSNGREVKELHGRKVIFTNPEDIQYFLTLLDAYSESISSNLSLKASEILKDLKLNIEYYEDVDEESREYGNTLDYGITVVDYLEQGEVKLEKRSLQRYFSELNNQGFIKVTGKRNRANMYDLVRKVSDGDSSELLNLSNVAKKRLSEEYPVDICKYLSMCDDMYVGNLSISDQLDNVIHPKWLSADKKGVKSKSDT